MTLSCGVGEESWELLLDGKEIKPVNPQGNQSWIFFGRTDAEAETPVLWQTGKNWLIWKHPDAGKDSRWEEIGNAEDEMALWHHWLDAYEFKQALGVGDGQGSLECCSPWDHKESDMTERLNWTQASCSSPLIHPSLISWQCLLLVDNSWAKCTPSTQIHESTWKQLYISKRK